MQISQRVATYSIGISFMRCNPFFALQRLIIVVASTEIHLFSHQNKGMVLSVTWQPPGVPKRFFDPLQMWRCGQQKVQFAPNFQPKTPEKMHSNENERFFWWGFEVVMGKGGLKNSCLVFLLLSSQEEVRTDMTAVKLRIIFYPGVSKRHYTVVTVQWTPHFRPLLHI